MNIVNLTRCGQCGQSFRNWRDDHENSGSILADRLQCSNHSGGQDEVVEKETRRCNERRRVVG